VTGVDISTAIKTLALDIARLFKVLLFVIYYTRLTIHHDTQSCSRVTNGQVRVTNLQVRVQVRVPMWLIRVLVVDAPYIDV